MCWGFGTQGSGFSGLMLRGLNFQLSGGLLPSPLCHNQRLKVLGFGFGVEGLGFGAWSSGLLGVRVLGVRL